MNTHRPLEGIRVIEHAGSVSGPYCGRLLADMGAEVLKVEPPVGDESRRYGPFGTLGPDTEGSALFLYVNAGKKSLTLDPRLPTGSDLFLRLIDNVDILIEDLAPGKMAALGLGYEILKVINPHLIYVSVTAFGQTGPYAPYSASDMQTFFSGSEGYALPGSISEVMFPGREPVHPGGYLADADAGMSTAVAVMAALMARATDGSGQYLDVSKHATALTLTREMVQRYTGYGEVINRSRSYFFGGIFEASDGYLTIFPRENRHWFALCDAMHRPDLADDARFVEFSGRRRHKDLLNGIVQEWVRGMPKREVYHRVSEAGCPAGYFATAQDLVESPQIAARQFLTEIDHPVAGPLPYPSAPYHMTVSQPGIRAPSPLLGQHTEEILCGRLGVPKGDLAALRRAGVV